MNREAFVWGGVVLFILAAALAHADPIPPDAEWVCTDGDAPVCAWEAAVESEAPGDDVEVCWVRWAADGTPISSACLRVRMEPS